MEYNVDKEYLHLVLTVSVEYGGTKVEASKVFPYFDEFDCDLTKEPYPLGKLHSFTHSGTCFYLNGQSFAEQLMWKLPVRQWQYEYDEVIDGELRHVVEKQSLVTNGKPERPPAAR